MPFISITRILTRAKGVLVPNSNAKFWIAQTFMLASTIIGVYLAASIGFEKAIMFDQITKQRTAFHILGALEGELKANNEKLIKLTKVASQMTAPQLRNDVKKLYAAQTFVWEAMKTSSEMFLIHPEVINRVREYYDVRENLIHRLATIEIGRNYFTREVKKLTDKTLIVLYRQIDDEKKRLGNELSNTSK